MTGTLPASLGQLSKLRKLQILENRLYGEFPNSIFALPELYDVGLRDNALIFNFPPVITAPLQSLELSGNWVNGTLPEMNWTRVAYLYVRSSILLTPTLVDCQSFFSSDGTDTQFKCPFPASFVAAAANLNQWYAKSDFAVSFPQLLIHFFQQISRILRLGFSSRVGLRSCVNLPLQIFPAARRPDPRSPLQKFL